MRPTGCPSSTTWSLSSCLLRQEYIKRLSPPGHSLTDGTQEGFTAKRLYCWPGRHTWGPDNRMGYCNGESTVYKGVLWPGQACWGTQWVVKLPGGYKGEATCVFIIYALTVCCLELNCRTSEVDKRMSSVKEIEKESFLPDTAGQYRTNLSLENGD